jgi:predicted transcriptional regulator YheO
MIKTVFLNETEFIKTVAESKSEYHARRNLMNYEEKLKILVKLQEKAIFMGKIKVKPWPNR